MSAHKEETMQITEGARPSGLTPSEELVHLKAVVRSLMNQAESILSEIELLTQERGVEEKILMLDHCIDFTRRLCGTNEQ